MSDKAMQACVRYVAISDQIKQLGRDISNALCACPGVIDVTAFGDVQRDRTHLSEWYSWRPHDFPELTDGPRPPLECEFCKQAHGLVEKRKAARRSLGRVKAEITKIGRKAS
jgi:hypothetical protein